MDPDDTMLDAWAHDRKRFSQRLRAHANKATPRATELQRRRASDLEYLKSYLQSAEEISALRRSTCGDPHHHPRGQRKHRSAPPPLFADDAMVVSTDGMDNRGEWTMGPIKPYPLFPTSPAAEASAPSVLPAGWEKAVSRSTGKVYYYCAATGESTYDWPVAAEEGFEAEAKTARARRAARLASLAPGPEPEPEPEPSPPSRSTMPAGPAQVFRQGVHELARRDAAEKEKRLRAERGRELGEKMLLKLWEEGLRGKKHSGSAAGRRAPDSDPGPTCCWRGGGVNKPKRTRRKKTKRTRCKKYKKSKKPKKSKRSKIKRRTKR